MLVDHCDTSAHSVPGRADVGGPAVDFDRTGVRPVDAGQDVHQRGLAGAVLAGQHQHLPGGQVQVHLVQRVDPPEALRDAAEPDQHDWR